MNGPPCACRQGMAACSHQPSSHSTAPTSAIRPWCQSRMTTSATAWASASMRPLPPPWPLVSSTPLRFGIACGVHRPCSVHRPCRLPGMCCYSVHDRSANTWARARLHCHPRHLISHTPYAAATAHDCCKAAGLLLEPDCILRTHARRQLCCCTLTIARDGFGWSALRSHTLARARSGRSGQESLHVQACCWRWCLWCTRRCGQAPTRPCSASRLTMGPLQSSRCWTTTLGGTM